MAAVTLNPPAPLVLDVHTSQQNSQWNKFRNNLELYFIAANITEDKQQRALLLYLGGEELKNIYEILDPGNKATFKEAITFLDKHFTEKINSVYERYTFRTLTQLPNENPRSFITRLRNAVSKCNFDKYSNNQAVIDTFIERINDSKLRRRLLKESDLTIDKLLEITLESEASELQASAIENKTTQEETINNLRAQPNFKSNKEYNSYSYTNSKKNESNSTKNSDKIRCYGCGRNGHIHGAKECPALGQQCNFCGGLNHFENICKRKKFNKGQWNKKENNFEKSSAFKKKFNNVLTKDDSSDEEEYLFSLNKSTDITIKIDEMPVEFLRDSGASINIIDDNTFNKLKRSININLLPTTTKIYAYNSHEPLQLKGVFYSNTEYKGNHYLAKIYVSANPNAGCILGRKASTELGVMKLSDTINSIETKDSYIDNLITEYKDLFSGLGKMKDIEIKFEIDESVKPVAQKLRRVPYHVRQKVEKKIKELLDMDIIEPVTGCSEWISPIIAVPKGEDVRIVVDMRKANTAIKRSYYPIPTLEELLTKFNGCSLFSKIDLRHGYHQIQLHEDSRSITAFVTHEGVYRYKRLVQGVNNAFTEYQYHISQIFKQEQLIENICDDILVAGRNEQEHHQNLRRCFEILKTNNLTVNPTKCIFAVPEVTFYGHTISQKGIRPTTGKIKAVKTFSEPKNVREVHSFLGLINYLGIYINNLATITYPLRNLIKKDTKWSWGEPEKEAFEKLKSIVTSDLCISHFDHALETILITDAGKIGLGAILAQRQINNQIKVVSYASRSLTKQEMKYSQTEREALGVVWACEKFHLFIYGKPFTILTDHQPLKVLYSHHGKPSPRILRWGLRLQSYIFNIEYIKGHLNPADILSIKPLQTCEQIENEMEQYINSLIAYATPKAVTLSDVIEHSNADESIQTIIHYLKYNNWDEKNPLVQEYNNVKTELTYKSGILLRGTQLVIPLKLRKQVLSLIHEFHLGITKSKSLIREKCWWPKMNKEIEDLVSNCITCIAVSRPNFQPMKHNTTPLLKPWEKVHIDLCGPYPNGTYALGIIDSCSRWPEIYLIRNTSTRNITKRLKHCFSIHGYPTMIVTDNGPNLISIDMKEFCQLYGIKHHKATPYWPQANSEIERFYSVLSKFVKTTTAEGRNWEDEYTDFLLIYRNTPHSTTNESPAKLLMNRSLRDKIPSLPNPENEIFIKAQKRDQEKKEQYKSYYDKRKNVKECTINTGDSVIMRNKRKGKLETAFDIQPYKVIRLNGTSITIMKNGKEVTRNSSEFKKVSSTEIEDEYESIDCKNTPPNDLPMLWPQPANDQNPNQPLPNPGVNPPTGFALQNTGIINPPGFINGDNPQPLNNPDNQNPQNIENVQQRQRKYPVRNQVIQYKRTDNEEWEKGKVIHDQPKKTGRYKNWINIHDEEQGTTTCVNWDFVENWQEV